MTVVFAIALRESEEAVCSVCHVSQYKYEACEITLCTASFWLVKGGVLVCVPVVALHTPEGCCTEHVILTHSV